MERTFAILVRGPEGWQGQASAEEALQALVLDDQSGPRVSIITASGTFHLHLEPVPEFELGTTDVVTAIRARLETGVPRELPRDLCQVAY
ncbi:MAG: hypothetical protein HYW37_00570 [Candidatus Colwellbacteria bacterium]|nr:hypothetical protein [Candidatus Colwellbacteria bacterium]